ncbi:hematopoietic progenitor cell antigen CD34 isoform X2 [Oryctolagus cuniculus]|uniref:hematopoietic progenitor cell antigen CD34 isoform X2 n=1 Tax=Oryctolagus cuniculus TaxID=9986 RepID=UPI003879304D
MLVRKGARAGPGMPGGWTALCLLSLLPSGFTNTDNSTSIIPEPTIPGKISALTTSVSSQESKTPSTTGSTSPSLTSQGFNGTTTTISETRVNLTSSPGTTPSPGTTNASVQPQTSLAVTVPITTLANFSTAETTLEPSTSPGSISNHTLNSTSPEISPTTFYMSSASTPGTAKGEIRCSGIREVRLTQGICLELNETSSCEDFKKDKGEELTQVLCGKEQADSEAGARVCSLLLAQSEVRAQCLLLVLANRTELSSMFQFMKKHQSDLRKLGIRDFTEQDVASHQSYSRKTLIALVTSGVLLAILGTTGYFLMNRRSWSPTGERLGEDPYSTENGGGQGYSSGPGASPEAQGKAGVKQGAQNGTGQATSRNGHSARQHVVADTEL